MTDPQVIVNLGTGGSDLNGQNGSTTSDDSNDARFLDWPGDSGGNYLYFPGVASNTARVPDEAALDITGDIDIRLHVALDQWASGATAALFDKWTASGNQRSWNFGLTSANALLFAFTADGSTGGANYNSTVAPTVADDEPLWIRVTRTANNGSGVSEAKFYTSDDGSTWTQLGATVTSANTALIYSGTSDAGTSGFNLRAFKLYRAQVLDGINGTVVLDMDPSVITSGSATSFTARTGQTVTINRSTSGRKTVAVVAPVWLFGTDDYMEVADNALLNFGASQSFTLVAIHRPWQTQGTNDTLIAKKVNTTNTTQGYSLSAGSTTALQGQSQIGDGSAGITAVSGSRTSGELTITAVVRNVASDNLIVYLNGSAGSAVTDTTTGSLSNSEVLRIARLSGAGTEYADMELIGVAVFRRALSVSELTQLTSYYQARLS